MIKLEGQSGEDVYVLADAVVAVVQHAHDGAAVYVSGDDSPFLVADEAEDVVALIGEGH